MRLQHQAQLLHLTNWVTHRIFNLYLVCFTGT